MGPSGRRQQYKKNSSAENGDEFAAQSPVAGEIFTGQSDQECKEGNAEAQEGDQVFSRMKLIRNNSRRDIGDQAHQRHDKKDQADQADGGRSIGIDKDMLIEDAKIGRAGSQSDKKQKKQGLQILRLFFNGIHQGLRIVPILDWNSGACSEDALACSLAQRVRSTGIVLFRMTAEVVLPRSISRKRLCP